MAIFAAPASKVPSAPSSPKLTPQSSLKRNFISPAFKRAYIANLFEEVVCISISGPSQPLVVALPTRPQSDRAPSAEFNASVSTFTVNFSTKLLVVRIPPQPPFTPKSVFFIVPPIAAWTKKVVPPQVCDCTPSKFNVKINSFWAPLVLLSAKNNSS